MKSHWLVQGLVVLALAGSAGAQTAWRDVAVPYYTPPAYVDGQYRHWYAPRSQAFADAASRLQESLPGGCAGTVPKQRYVAALLAWDAIATVAVGPLLERRSVRRIDFVPTRPELIERAIRQAPRSEADMERVGSAAKGLPALEWLLYKRKPADAAACAYANQVAADITREAQALAGAYAGLASQERDDTATVAAMSESVNQWIGGVEQLRIQGIEKPLGDALARGRPKPQFARDASGASVAERNARWATLRSQAVFEGRVAPAAGEALVPLEAYLRGKGLNPLADRLAAAVRRVDDTLKAPPRLEAAARSLAALKALAEAEIAPALDISIGFSDADGD